MSSKQDQRNELVSQINSWKKAANYEGCPFPGYEKIKAHRKDHPKVLEAVMNCLKQKNYSLANKSVIDIGSNLGYFPFSLRMQGAGKLHLVERQGLIQNAIKKIIEIENLNDVEVIGQKLQNLEQAESLPKCDVVVYKSVHHWIKKFIAQDSNQQEAEKIGEQIFRAITSKASLVVYEPCNFGNALPTKEDNDLARKAGFDVTVVVNNGFKNRDIQVCLR